MYYRELKICYIVHGVTTSKVIVYKFAEIVHVISERIKIR